MAEALSRASWVRVTALAVAGSLTAGPVRAQAAPIRIGAGGNEGFGPVFYAKDAGFFDRAGLPVEIVILQNGPAIAAGMAGGSLDIGSSSPFVFMNARRHGLPYTIIAPGILYESSDPFSALVVPASSTIRSAKDLEGKVVGGMTVGAMDELGIRAWIDQNGGDAKTVKVIEIAASAMVDAMDQGRLAAALVPEPQLTAAGNRVRRLGYAYDAIAKEIMISVYFTTYSWAQRHPDESRKFREALIQTAAWSAANREKAADILEKYTKIRIPRIRSTAATRLDPALIQPVVDAAWKYRMIDAPMEAKDWIWNGRVPAA
jgi:NitT/TauT family transport system substrate-binding protein